MSTTDPPHSEIVSCLCTCFAWYLLICLPSSAPWAMLQNFELLRIPGTGGRPHLPPHRKWVGCTEGGCPLSFPLIEGAGPSCIPSPALVPQLGNWPFWRSCQLSSSAKRVGADPIPRGKCGPGPTPPEGPACVAPCQLPGRLRQGGTGTHSLSGTCAGLPEAGGADGGSGGSAGPGERAGGGERAAGPR